MSRSYKDISTFEQYLDMQQGMFESWEGNSDRIKQAMTRAFGTLLEGVERDTFILDAACGDGQSLVVLSELGFTRIYGIEYNDRKAKAAAERGIGHVCQGDMHDMIDLYDDDCFEVIISSHSLEHMYDPRAVIEEFSRLLVPHGRLFVILPYPDGGDERAHGGKYDLGTRDWDEGRKVRAFFESCGYTVNYMHFDSLRENEVWLGMTKND